MLVPIIVETLELEALLRLVIAAICGAAIGTEREMAGKYAGLRTNTLICLGAALFTFLSIKIGTAVDPEELVPEVIYRTDPARIAAQIVSGIGFLGAGAILQARGRIVGLTTAATIWVVAAIGMAAGAGAYVIAIGTTLITLFILFPVQQLERRQRRDSTTDTGKRDEGT